MDTLSEQYARVLIEYARFKEIVTPTARGKARPLALDSAHLVGRSFFEQVAQFQQQLWHEHPALRDAIDAHIASNRAPSLVTDYCGFYHERAPSGGVVKVNQETHANPPLSWASAVITTIDGAKIDAFAIATELIRDWNSFLKTHQILPQQLDAEPVGCDSWRIPWDLEKQLADADTFIAHHRRRIHISSTTHLPFVEGHFGNVRTRRQEFATLTRTQALEAHLVMMRMLQVEYNDAHACVFEICKDFCASEARDQWEIAMMYTPPRWEDADTFYQAAKAFFSLLVPGEHGFQIADSMDRHSVLGPTAFALIEAILRRRSFGHLGSDGTVLKPWTVSHHARLSKYDPVSGKKCSSIRDAFLLQRKELDVTQPAARHMLDRLGAEFVALLPPSAAGTDLYQEIHEWRNAWLHGARVISNRVTALAVVLSFLLVAHMSDGDFSAVAPI